MTTLQGFQNEIEQIHNREYAKQRSQIAAEKEKEKDAKHAKDKEHKQAKDDKGKGKETSQIAASEESALETQGGMAEIEEKMLVSAPISEVIGCS